MKTIEYFFQMLTEYQILKTKLKIEFEKAKVDLKIYYTERINSMMI